MTSSFFKKRAPAVALLAIACTVVAAGCSSSSSSSASSGSSSSSSASASSSAKASGSVNVAYASSLQYLNTKVAGPAFTKATGYAFSGRAASSGDLEADIASGEIKPDVFESVGGDNITPLMPKFTRGSVQSAAPARVWANTPRAKSPSQFKAIADGSKPIQDLFTLLQT